MPESKNESYGTNSSVAQKYVAVKDTRTSGFPIRKFGFDEGRVIGHPSENSFGSRHPMHPGTYFTELTARKALLYVVAMLYVLSCGAISVAEMFLTVPCPDSAKIPVKYPNPDYDGSKCPHIRQPILLGLTPMECSFGRRLVMSILMGGVIGWERRQADRPAGIRTMSLVSLGSCLFTINSAFAFVGGPMEWDASRISAAIPSGVGFLGAGLIFKKTSDDENNMVVHGLTTAASVWLSAAVGIACGGELYFAASFGTCLMMLLLRFGPRGSDMVDEDYHEEDEEDDADADEEGELNQLQHDSFRLEIPPGMQSTAEGTTMIFRSSDGSQNLPPGLQVPKSQASVDGSTRGEFTVTGESIETSQSETTPMLQQLLVQQLATPKVGHSSRSNSQSRLSKKQRKSSSKSMRIRKRHSKANLGSIV